jgi:hypothetical protein
VGDRLDQPSPKGGKPGQRHKATLMAEALLIGEADTLVRKLIDSAKAGDMLCLRACVDKILPPQKSRPFRFKLPPLHTIADAQQALADIIAGTARGTILSDEATALTGMVNAFVKTIEVSEIESRLVALEQGVKASAEEHRYNA